MDALQNGLESKLKLQLPVMPKPSHCGPSVGTITPATLPTSSGPVCTSSTTSSDTPLSPSLSHSPSSTSISGSRRPMPPPRSCSIPHNDCPHEEDDMSPTSTSAPIHIYPSPPYTVDSKIIISSPDKSPVRESDPLHLHELVEKYSNSFPLQIKVLHGYSGQTSQLTISSGDFYNIHFVKHQEVASINDKLGFTYTIPLNSSFRFGPVYSTDVFHQNTHIYEKVADVLALSPLPKVMCALADVRTTDEKNSLTVNEILVIKRVIRSKLRKKSLEVLSLKSQKPKILPHDCSGHFTLNPKHNQIYLLELVRCIPDPFPSKAVMFLSSDTASNLHKISHSVLNAVVTLTGQKTETSLIASSVTYTTCEEEGGEIGAQVSEHLVDIPVDERLKDVMVVLVDSSDSGLQEILNRKTRTLFETFDVTRVRSWYKTPADTANDATQHVLYASIGRGMKGVGIHVDKPPAAFKNYSLAGREEALYESVYNPSTDDTDSLSPHHFTTSTEYPTQYEQPHLSLQHMSHSTPTAITFPGIPAVGDVRPEVRYDPLPSLAQPALAANRTLRRSRSQYTLPMRDLPTDCYEHMRPQVPLSPSVPPRYVSRQTVEPKLEQLLLSTASLQSQVGDLSHRMLRMEDQLRELAQMNTVTKRLLEGISALSVEASQQRSQSDHSRGTLETLTTESERQRVQNQQYLGTLDLPQIEEVLRAMGLPQYITRFRQEQVTGSLLLQCSEGMLREELGIDSLLHCKRLMAVITGHQSVRNLSLKSSSTN